MIRFIYGDDLDSRPQLAASMFRDRASQFRSRLQWDVHVDENGWERDQYDQHNPLYVIYETPDGLHGGSGRLMSTLGPTMVNDHFTSLSGGVTFTSPFIWESTRFCVSPRLTGELATARKISTALMLAGCEVGLKYGLNFYVAVFDAPMRRIYRSTGWSPEIIGRSDDGALCLGLFEISEQVRDNIRDRAPADLDLDLIPPAITRTSRSSFAAAAA